MRFRHRRLATARALTSIAVTLAVSLTACGGSDPEPSPSSPPASPATSPATSPEPAASPKPGPPDLPPAATKDTKAGAIAFAHHYIDLINYAQATGDVRALKEVEDPGCESCIGGRRRVSEIYESGGRIVGGDLAFRPTGALKNANPPGWTVFGSITYGPQRIVSAEPAESPQALDGGTSTVSIVLGRATSAWYIADWTRL